MGIRSILLLCIFRCLSVDVQVLDSLPHDFLLIVDRMSGTIYRTDISNNSYVTIPLHDLLNTNDIDYDPTADVTYASNISHIISISSTGDRQTTVRAFGEYADIVGIAVDSTSRLLFYTDKGNAVIGVISLDNKSHKTVIRNVEHPMDIVVDPINGSIYWSEKGLLEQILEMSNYDGTNRKQLGQNRVKRLGLDEPAIILDLDFNGGDLYLCESGGETTTIRRLNVSGSNGQLIYGNEEETYLCSITVDQSYVYFTFGSDIQRIGTDGTGETVIPSADEDTYPTYIHLHTNRGRVSNGCSSGRDGCSHYCFPLPGGSRMCSCPDFMTLLPDRHTCQGSSILLITTNDRPHIYAIDPSNGQDMTIVLENLDEPHAISYDPVNGTVYWTDTKFHMILSASLSGQSKRDIRYLKINSSPQGIAVDATSRLLFYTDKENGIIAALSLDGSSHKVVIRSTFDEPEAIVTNPINGTIFWTSFGTNGKIETANYDGTNRQELINTGHEEPSGLAIDITEPVLYWCIAGGIYKADLNGFNRHLIYKESKSSIFRIAFYQSYLYFTSSSRRYVMKIGIDERKPMPFGHATAGNIVDLHLFNGTLIIDGHGCSNVRDSCSHLCFPRPGGLKMCACPDGMFLESDGQTCQTSATSLHSDYTMNAQSNRPPSSSEIDGSSVGLTVLRAAVGAFVGLLVISVLLNVYFLRKKKSDDVGVTHVLWFASLFPAVAEEYVHVLRQCWYSALEDFRRNVVASRCLPIGIHYWTLGQRAQIGGKSGALFVADKNTETQDITVVYGTDHPALFSQTMFTEPAHWINQPPHELLQDEKCDMDFRFQHIQKLIKCTVTSSGSNCLTVSLQYPLRAITGGQYAVFYRGDVCLGSAKILHPGPSLYMMNQRERVREPDIYYY